MKSDSLYGTIENVLEYVENNLKSPITLDEISRHVSMSKFHLNRTFRAIAKTPLMNYVKYRKLSSSAIDLLSTDLKVSDISQEYGFSYEQSYIRAFENVFGVTPNRYRRQKSIIQIKEKLNLDFLRAAGRDGLAFDPSIVIVPEFYAAGIRHKILEINDRLFNEASAFGNDFFNNHRHHIKNALDYDTYIGLVEHVPGESKLTLTHTDPRSYNYYMPSLMVPGPENIPAGMTCRKIPTNKYAVFKYIGLHHPMHININNLTDTFKYIFAQWFPASGYTSMIPYHYERLELKHIRDDFCEMEIYIPLSPVSAPDQ